VFTTHFWEKADLDKIFTELHDPKQGVGGLMDVQRVDAMRIVHKVAERVPPRAQWVDVGSGNGALVFTSSEYGYDSTGIDTRIEPVSGLNKLGYTAYQGNGVEWNYQGVDIVSLGDVLEHLAFPKEFLELLHKDGVKLVYISCPNMDTATWKATGLNDQNGYWNEKEHHHNFTRKRLYALLREVGFEPYWYDTSLKYMSNMEVYAYRT
jgi:hypothetical protein